MSLKRELEELKASNAERFQALATHGASFGGFDMRYVTMLLEAIAGEELATRVELEFQRSLVPILFEAEQKVGEVESARRRAAIAAPGPLPPSLNGKGGWG